MKFEIYHVDAFSDRVFGGNPAAVIPLKDWISPDLMQAIAMENQLSETAFFVKDQDGYSIRWFTPMAEVDFCGHATIATAHIIFSRTSKDISQITFQSKSGPLTVNKKGDWLELDGPAIISTPEQISIEARQELGVEPLEVLASEAQDIIIVVPTEDDVLRQSPRLADFMSRKYRGVVVTARGTNHDFVSRFFGIDIGVSEDPVTGSAHCQLAPYWAKKLGKPNLKARQISHRPGEVQCHLKDNQVLLKGQAVTYLSGRINVNSGS